MVDAEFPFYMVIDECCGTEVLYTTGWVDDAKEFKEQNGNRDLLILRCEVVTDA